MLHQISLESKLNGWQKVKGGNGSITASISTSIIASIFTSISARRITLNPGVGCAPSCWPIFGSETSWVLAGAQRAVFCAVRVADFLAEGAGWRASPGRGGRVGGPQPAGEGLKKIVRLAAAFPSPPFRSSDFAGPRRPPYLT